MTMNQGPAQNSVQQAFQQGIALFGAARFQEAAAIADAILRQNQGDPRGLALRAMTSLQFGRYQEALDAATRAIHAAPGQVMTITLRARALRLLGRTDEAIDGYRQAVAIAPDHPIAMADLAELLLSLRRLDEAETLLSRAMNGPIAHPQLAMSIARLHRIRKEPERGIAILEAVLQQPNLPEGPRVDVMFALGHLLDACGEHRRAFAILHDANAAHGSQFEPATHRAAVDRMIDAFSRTAMDGLPKAKPAKSASQPVFIVGLPRSGTTLVERILAAHPDVYAGGELEHMHRLTMEMHGRMPPPLPWIPQDPRALTPSFVNDAARNYAKLLPRPGKGAPPALITDKMPENILRIPVIRALFPQAPIIHITRDLRDTALSCYFQHFSGAVAWSYDQAHLASYFADVHRAASHMQAIDLNITQVSYEDLVNDPEPAARALVDAVGLPWHDACLAHHTAVVDSRTRSVDQVNEPIYTRSRGRWEQYTSELGEMFDAVMAISARSPAD